MLEIPESLTIARQLNETVKGKRIVQAQAGHTKHGFTWYEGDPVEYGPKIEGKIVGESMGIGSKVEIEIGDYSLVFADGANLRYYPEGTRLPDRHQLRIFFEDGSCLSCTVQMYAGIYLIRPREYSNPYYLVAKEKPMPCTEAFDYEYFSSLREGLAGNLSIKAFLATQQRIPGLGNGVLQDILLEAGLHPKHKIGSLREADWKRVYESVTGVLGRMIELGGRDTERNLFGEAGGYRTKLSKKTVGGPCPYCGNIISKTSYLGGTVYYCTECQIQ